MTEKKLPHDHGQSFEKNFDHMPDTCEFQTVSDIFKQLGDGSRIRIFWILCHREECVQEIAALMEMSSAAISHHLRRLRACELIISRREGKEVYYRAADTKEARFLHQMIEDLLDITCPQERRV